MLARTEDRNHVDVSFVTPLGRTTGYSLDYQPSGVEKRVALLPNGLVGSSERAASGALTRTAPDGTLSTTTIAGDPRWVCAPRTPRAGWTSSPATSPAR
jgi:hypothetical protein